MADDDPTGRAVEAAAEALLPVICPNPKLFDQYRPTAQRQARAAVAAALPVLLDALVEQIHEVLREAVEHRDQFESWTKEFNWRSGRADGLARAAGLVRRFRQDTT